MTIRSAEQPHDEHGRQYHIGLAPGELADNVMLVGHPARATRVAEMLERVEVERRNREYVTYTGIHDGLPLSVMATGMGPDNTEIAVVEIAACVEGPTLIRCGSSGGLRPDLELGDLVVSRGAYRLENTSLHFVGEGYPAIADHEVFLALLQAAAEGRSRHHVGLTATASGFYGAQARRTPGFAPREPTLLADLEAQGILNIEMETSCLFTLAMLRGLRAGAVCAIYGNRHTDAFLTEDAKSAAELNCVETGLRAFHILATMDQQRSNNDVWHPGLI